MTFFFFYPPNAWFANVSELVSFIHGVFLSEVRAPYEPNEVPWLRWPQIPLTARAHAHTHTHSDCHTEIWGQLNCAYSSVPQHTWAPIICTFLLSAPAANSFSLLFIITAGSVPFWMQWKADSNFSVHVLKEIHFEANLTLFSASRLFDSGAHTLSTARQMKAEVCACQKPLMQGKK